MYLEVSEGAQIGSVGEALVSIVDDGDAGVIEFKETKYSAVRGRHHGGRCVRTHQWWH